MTRKIYASVEYTLTDLSGSLCNLVERICGWVEANIERVQDARAVHDLAESTRWMRHYRSDIPQIGGRRKTSACGRRAFSCSGPRRPNALATGGRFRRPIVDCLHRIYFDQGGTTSLERA